MYKAGDEILCKKDGYKKNIHQFRKNEFYYIISINHIKYSDVSYRVKGETEIFTFYDNTEHMDLLSNYFYSEKEIRKIKLLKFKNES